MEPFIGQIMTVGFNFAPRGWAFCDGQLLAISQNQALFSLLGTIYGGDGRTTFALPDLRGRVATHQGTGPGLSPMPQGQRGGAERVTLEAATIPSHTHAVSLSVSSEIGTTATPSTATVLAKGIVQDGRTKLGDANIYSEASNETMNSVNIANTGGTQSHENRQPYLAINYIIALQGTYPSRN
ncbi:MAG: tail fiber protein [Sulfurovum sp.]|nr:tail fiber protein [Sulfurovum sp.]